jgi:hypothetical protein
MAHVARGIVYHDHTHDSIDEDRITLRRYHALKVVSIVALPWVIWHSALTPSNVPRVSSASTTASDVTSLRHQHAMIQCENSLGIAVIVNATHTQSDT